MVFTLTLPLIGLEPTKFSALSTRFQCEVIQGWPPSAPEQISPSAIKNSNDVSCLALFGSTRDEESSSSSSPSVSSSSTKSASVGSESPREQRSEQDIRIMYQGRDILNLAANIRDPVWSSRDMWHRTEEYESLTPSRSIMQRLQVQTLTEDDTMDACTICKFRQPKPYLY
ncbi:uncharacterized protein LOC105191296 [Harpegnathos saltator]|uniref:Uncharacterized protein n=1 Tax=Harpegnathos saltator TaxID=610380 RepID=E2C954_HARSA|nr:uncharacterized protein LOC105191296 [Harpegnathos saltator]EFN75527.1 hypothetical protein EAI_03553 [Harpegnathos saltator]